MLTKDAVSHFGSVTALAQALGIERQAIYMWKAKVPKLRAYQIQSLTGGKLQANGTASRKGHRP